jgi:hypothetical protein
MLLVADVLLRSSWWALHNSQSPATRVSGRQQHRALQGLQEAILNDNSFLAPTPVQFKAEPIGITVLEHLSRELTGSRNQTLSSKHG